MTSRLRMSLVGRRTALLAVLLASTPLTWRSDAPRVDARTLQTTLTVTTTADAGAGSLRQALLDAGAASEATPVVITFDIPGCAGACRIRVQEALPEIDRASLTIDGFTQPGAAPATDGMPAVLGVELAGPGPAGPDGLRLTGSDLEVRGLAIYDFGGHGIAIRGSSARRIVVAGNHIGVDATGEVGVGNARAGVAVTAGAQEVRIGGPQSADRNVISGNVEGGVLVLGSNTRDVTIAGNRIGVDSSGLRAMANAGAGVRVAEGAKEVYLGRAVSDLLPAQPGNLISGNQGSGVRLEGADTTTLSLLGNWIGMAQDGVSALPNGGDGVSVDGGVRGVTIGGEEAPSRNLVAGNMGHGVHVALADEVSIRGAWIGTDAGGELALPNGGDGVRISSATGLVVGGEAAAGNLISGNAGHGVHLVGSGAEGVIVAGNRIGTDGAGQAPLPNGGDGVRLGEGARDNVVGVVSDAAPGPPAAPAGNLIAANAGAGVAIVGAGSTGNVVAGNYIGIAADGVSTLGNQGPGVLVADGAASNVVGGVTGAGGEAGNSIGGNAVGVRIEGSGTDGNQVVGNRIGTTPDGEADLPNRDEGVVVAGGARDSVIGPGNTVAFNGGDGVRVEGVASAGHRITRNGMHANGGAGIALVDGANGEIAAPVLDAAPLLERRVFGTACAACTVELFGSTFDDGEGRNYVAQTVADEAGSFAFDLPPTEDSYFTATASDVSRGTSAFSNVAAAPPATAVPTATQRPRTATPTPSVTPIPSATPMPTALPPSATPTETRAVTPGPTPTEVPGATETPPNTATVSPPTEVPAATATEAPSLTATVVPTATPPVEPTSPPTAAPSPEPTRWRIHLPLARKGT